MLRIDPHVGPRAALFAHFRAFDQPHFTLCAPVRVDVQRLRAEGGLFPNLLHAALAAANAVPELRRRIRVEGGVDVIVQHEVVHCTATVLRDDGSFQFTYFEHDPVRERFVASVGERVAEAAASDGLDRSQQHRDDLLYVSSVPWIPIASAAPAMSGERDSCAPQILWGRVEEGRCTVCVTAHHALVDGLHVGRFVQEFQRRVGGTPDGQGPQ